MTCPGDRGGRVCFFVHLDMEENMGKQLRTLSKLKASVEEQFD